MAATIPAAARQLSYALPSANASIEVIEQHDDDDNDALRHTQGGAGGGGAPSDNRTSTEWASTATYYAPRTSTQQNPAQQPARRSHFADGMVDGAAHRSSHRGGTQQQQPAPQLATAASMDDRVAERILDTLRSKDACIAELERSVDFLSMETARLKTELDDVTMTKETLITQYGDVMQDLRDMERVAADRDEAQRQSAAYAMALDDANKALALQLEALNEQVQRSDAAEAARKATEDEKRTLDGKVASLTHKNHKLLEELRQMAEESDASESKHQGILQEAHDAIAQLRSQVNDMAKVGEEKRHLEVQLKYAEATLNERQEALETTRGELQVTKAELADVAATRDRSQAHVSAHREALVSSDRTLQHTEALAHNAATELNALRSAHSELEAKVAALEAQIATQERNHDAMQSELDEAVRMSQEWHQRCDEARRDAARLHDALEASTATYEAKAIQWQQELDVCNHQLSTQQTILTTRRELEATMTEERDEQSRNVEELEDTVETAQRTAQKWRARHRALEAEYKRLCEELRSTHVVHAAECRDLQELSSAVAAGQSKQLSDMTNSQEAVVQRLIAAEEEIARLTERSSLLGETLRLREEDVAHFSRQHAAELKRGQTLSMIAADKERQDEELIDLRGRVVPALEQRLHETAKKLESVQRRYANLKEKVAADSIHVSRAKSVEVDAQASTQALEAKVSALETALNAKREGLRAALDERNRLLALIDEGRRELSTMQSRIRTVQKQAEDRERTCNVRMEQAEAAARQHVADLATLKQANETRISTGIRHVAGALVAAFRVLTEKCIRRNSRNHDRHLRATEMINRLVDKYQRDVDAMQAALVDARYRWRNEASRAAALQETIVRLQHDAQQQQAARRHHGDPQQDRLATGASAVPSPPGADALVRGSAAGTLHSKPTTVSVDNVSHEIRSACHNISLEVLGLAGGLDELVALQATTTLGYAQPTGDGGRASSANRYEHHPTHAAAVAEEEVRGMSLSPMHLGDDGGPGEAWRALLDEMASEGVDGGLHPPFPGMQVPPASAQHPDESGTTTGLSRGHHEDDVHRRNVAELQLISFDRSSLGSVLVCALRRVFEINDMPDVAASSSSATRGARGAGESAVGSRSYSSNADCQQQKRCDSNDVMTATERVRLLLFGTTMPSPNVHLGSDGDALPLSQRRGTTPIGAPTDEAVDDGSKRQAATTTTQHQLSHQPLETTLIALAQVLS